MAPLALVVDKPTITTKDKVIKPWSWIIISYAAAIFCCVCGSLTTPDIGFDANENPNEAQSDQ